MSTSMSYWPTELYQFDALNQMYGDSIAVSPLHRAYSLHKINIEAGEKLMNELQQQGQHHDDNATTTTTERSVDGDAASSGGSSSTGSKASPSSDFSNGTDKNNSSSSSSNNSAGSQGKESGEPQEPPSLDYNRQQLDNLREASTDIRQNLLRLNVYLEDLSVVKYKQMPAYGMEDLVADIGGTLGLWMGVSVLTIMELLELIFRLSYLFMRAERKPEGPSLSERQKETSTRGDSLNEERNGRSRSRSPFDDNNHHSDHLNHHTDHQHNNRPSRDGNDSDHEVDPFSTDHEGRGGYSYRTEADYNRHLEDGHGLFETNGNGVGVTSPNSVAPLPRTEYSGRTKYWRLMRGKSKR